MNCYLTYRYSIIIVDVVISKHLPCTPFQNLQQRYSIFMNYTGPEGSTVPHTTLRRPSVKRSNSQCLHTNAKNKKNLTIFKNSSTYSSDPQIGVQIDQRRRHSSHHCSQNFNHTGTSLHCPLLPFRPSGFPRRIRSYQQIISRRLLPSQHENVQTSKYFWSTEIPS